MKRSITAASLIILAVVMIGCSATKTGSNSNGSGNGNPPAPDTTVASVKVAPDGITIQEYSTSPKFTATAFNKEGSVLNGVTFKWSGGKNNGQNFFIADDNVIGYCGNVLCPSVQMTATANGVNGSATVYITPEPISKLTLSAPSIISPGQVFTVDTSVTDAVGQTVAPTDLAQNSLVYSCSILYANGAVDCFKYAGSYGMNLNLPSVTSGPLPLVLTFSATYSYPNGADVVTVASNSVTVSVADSLPILVPSDVILTPHYSPNRTTVITTIGQPISFSAQVVDQKGNPMNLPVNWGCAACDINGSSKSSGGPALTTTGSTATFVQTSNTTACVNGEPCITVSAAYLTPDGRVVGGVTDPNSFVYVEVH